MVELTGCRPQVGSPFKFKTLRKKKSYIEKVVFLNLELMVRLMRMSSWLPVKTVTDMR